MFSEDESLRPIPFNIIKTGSVPTPNPIIESIELLKVWVLNAFNIAKSIWNIAFESIDIFLRKNKNNINSSLGYIVFYRKSEEKLYVWEYEIKNDKKDKSANRAQLRLISEGGVDEKTFTDIIDSNSKWNQNEFYKNLPVFEIKCSQNFPFEQTMVPIIKRKVMAHISQSINIGKINIFDIKD